LQGGKARFNLQVNSDCRLEHNSNWNYDSTQGLGHIEVRNKAILKLS